jgi:hypothetical protein
LPDAGQRTGRPVDLLGPMRRTWGATQLANGDCHDRDGREQSADRMKAGRMRHRESE